MTHSALRLIRTPLACAAVLAASVSAAAQTPTPAPAPAPAPSTRYVRSNAMITMRDGVRLNTEIFTPRGQTQPLPILFLRTPYGVDGRASTIDGAFRELAADDYIFVFQDIRGRYKSEGAFVMQRPARTTAQRRDPKAIDEATDAYDTIDWLIKNVPNTNGRAGMLGVSYDGWTTAMALTDPHPALRAASPQASPADMWIGDDFHHNGAFRLSYGFEYAARLETSKEQTQFAFDKYDTYDWYLALGPLANANAKHFHGKIPTWNDFVAHPNFDAFWKAQTIIPALTQVTVPTLNVAGWWDQEDFYGPLAIYAQLERFDRDRKNFLVVGPWNHGGWSRGDGQKLGNIDFGSATSFFYRDSIQRPFFAFYLKDRGPLSQPEAMTFEAGTNRWRRFDAWPPVAGVTQRRLYLNANGVLSFEAAPGGRGATTFEAFTSDPAHPVPYRMRPIQATYDPRGSGWRTWLTEDQRFVHGRPDVLTWQTEPLTEDITIAGEVIANLTASTTGTDADWIVKLIDVYPEEVRADIKMSAYQFMVSNEVLRGRFRSSFERPSPIPANTPTLFRYSLHGQNYAFLRGHRIMVQVQSSWFPIIDRNPQTYVPNIFEAKATDYRAQTHRVYGSSYVAIPVVTR